MPSFFDIPAVLAWLSPARLDTALARYALHVRHRYRRSTEHFRTFLEIVDPAIGDPLHAWICDRLQVLQAPTVWLDISILRGLLKALKPNPIEGWLSTHPGGVEGLRKLQGTPPARRWRPRPFQSFLADDMDAFIAHKRQLGRKYERQWFALRWLDRFIVSRALTRIEEVDSRLLSDFAASLTWIKKSTKQKQLYLLRYFFRFLRRCGRLTTEPDAVIRPVFIRRSTLPYIFTLKELSAMMSAAHRREKRNGLLAYAVLHLIYASGLRAGEALRLGVRDVDLEAGIIFVRDTKFGKSRRIPIGRRSTELLTAWEKQQQPPQARAPFLVNHRGKALTYMWLREVFQRARDLAGIQSADRPVPRIHDLRHTFAVHRLYKWYSDGQRPQDKLPLLSAYMGHVDYRFTEHYLQLTSDLLRQAGAACGHGLDAMLSAISWNE